MEWLKELFVEHSALQAVVVVSLISTIGIGLGKIRFFGISLGTAFIFFVGILAGHFGLSLDPAMLTYAESFGLVIFVYALGLQVGPGFFSSMRADGLRLVSPAIAIVLLGTALAMAMSYAFGVSMPDMSGILCGATTNTPALGAAQQTLQQMGIDANGAALSCAVAYPLGVVGVILAVVFLRKLFVRPCDMPGPDAEHRKNVFIASYHLTNPAVFGKSVHEIATQSHHHFVISRLWRDGRVSIPTSDKTLQENDLILVITTPGEADSLRLIFGEQETKDWNTENIDWNSVDSQLISQRILVTRPEINGKKLSQLRLRNTYGINISRVYRSGVQLLATPDLRLQLGDRLTVVGEAEAIRNVEKILGMPKFLKEEYEVGGMTGVVTGLAWTEVGGDILYIESVLTPGKGKVSLTGNLGEVMKESATIAHEWTMAHYKELGIDPKLFETNDINIHVPEGAIPKDGPSAGITMVTSIVSSYTGRKGKERIAMTGETTLRGRVMPVGGVKEKILAAKRAGITELILSEENRKDIAEIKPEYIAGLTFHYVKTNEEVLQLALE